MKLHLGCGDKILEGYQNIDLESVKEADKHWDINKRPFPFKNDSAEEILMINVLEHLDSPIETIEECHRILKPGGKLVIEVPHFTSAANHNDPTHKTMFGYKWFDFFVEGSRRDYYFNFKFKNLSKELIFGKGYPKKILNKIFNRFPTKYEYSILKSIPCKRIRVVLTK